MNDVTGSDAINSLSTNEKRKGNERKEKIICKTYPAAIELKQTMRRKKNFCIQILFY